MCVVCSTITQNPACGAAGCPISFWQQNLNTVIMTVSPILGGIYLWGQNLWKKIIRKS
jgi:hypothetical protein